MDAANQAADDAVAAGQELKDTVVEKSEAAVESVKEISATAVEKTDAMIASVSGDDLSRGESIFKNHCFACHGTGVAGAPKLGDKTAWGARITQGNAVLTRHAIEGFKGDKGYMPPKGGFMSLSDDEIAATVQYMVSQSQ
jgi:cytochrome c5